MGHSVFALISLSACLAYVCPDVGVLQPEVLTVRAGQTASLECDVRKHEGYYMQWYKQVPGEAPRFLLQFVYSENKHEKYGSGFSKDRFTGKGDSTGAVYHLIINSVELADTGLYHCKKTYKTSSGTVPHSYYHYHRWEAAASRDQQRPGGRLMGSNWRGLLSWKSGLWVSGLQLPPPSVSVLRAAEPGGGGDRAVLGQARLVCQVTKLSVGLVDVEWVVDGNSTSIEAQTSQPVREPDNTYTLSSYLSVPAADWHQGKVHSCRVRQGGSLTQRDISSAAC
ncbi:immunoglobulin lambda-1 light chain-like [Callorhinchus milii]|uniref:immunoglobulin lambda-1 light chain-like n=1 Tax=Callorhinchus milii TaxID=7868 RepID=UPI001C3F9F7C|nr:immunoglobulin lambda-1 light chain-like [Callorhinchus milii]